MLFYHLVPYLPLKGPVARTIEHLLLHLFREVFLPYLTIRVIMGVAVPLAVAHLLHQSCGGVTEV